MRTLVALHWIQTSRAYNSLFFAMLMDWSWLCWSARTEQLTPDSSMLHWVLTAVWATVLSTQQTPTDRLHFFFFFFFRQVSLSILKIHFNQFKINKETVKSSGPAHSNLCRSGSDDSASARCCCGKLQGAVLSWTRSLGLLFTERQPFPSLDVSLFLI